MKGDAGLDGWRWIFIIEGICNMCHFRDRLLLRYQLAEHGKLALE